jgi:hypothetical protein
MPLPLTTHGPALLPVRLLSEAPEQVLPASLNEVSCRPCTGSSKDTANSDALTFEGLEAGVCRVMPEAELGPTVSATATETKHMSCNSNKRNQAKGARPTHRA